MKKLRVVLAGALACLLLSGCGGSSASFNWDGSLLAMQQKGWEVVVNQASGDGLADELKGEGATFDIAVMQQVNCLSPDSTAQTWIAGYFYRFESDEQAENVKAFVIEKRPSGSKWVDATFSGGYMVMTDSDVVTSVTGGAYA